MRKQRTAAGIRRRDRAADNCHHDFDSDCSDNHRYEVTLTNPTQSVAFMLRLTAKDNKSQLLCPAFWSDNYITLAPGEQRTVTCTLPDDSGDTENATFFLEGWNVKPTVIN